MVGSWESQIDYIIFLSGLALIILAVVCFLLKKSGNSILPWIYLMLFGTVHGVYQWLDMTAYSIGDGWQFGAFRNIFMIASYLFLIEFGRSGVKRITGRG
ncbi:MAG: hypothetical protein ACYDEQ_15650, partial [Desulfocucumaceae bacterium]